METFNLSPQQLIFLAVSLLGTVVAVWIVYAADRSTENNFHAVDLILCDGRACLDKVILALFSVVSAWVIVHVTITGAKVDSTLLLGVLTIFVLKRTADKVTTAYKDVITTSRQNERPE